jgi:arylsulfatase A-like enzyme
MINARLVNLIVLTLLVCSVRADEPPNIVLIFSDDQGVNDVGCYGSEIPTPNIDRIAAQGTRFTSWYSASSICTPSRYGLLTGRNPNRSQDQLLSALMFLSAADRDRGLRDHEQTIAEVLKSVEYTTALIGKWHLGHGSSAFLPVNHGFDMFKGHTGGCIDYFTMTYGKTLDWYEGTQHVSKNGYATELITEEAVQFLKSQQSAAKPSCTCPTTLRTLAKAGIRRKKKPSTSCRHRRKICSVCLSSKTKSGGSSRQWLCRWMTVSDRLWRL